MGLTRRGFLHLGGMGRVAGVTPVPGVTATSGSTAVGENRAFSEAVRPLVSISTSTSFAETPSNCARIA